MANQEVSYCNIELSWLWVLNVSASQMGSKKGYLLGQWQGWFTWGLRFSVVSLCIIHTWNVCCAEEACRCVSWWALSSRFTSRGMVPASLSGAWLAGHNAKFRIRPTVAWKEDRDQRRFSIWVSFKSNFTCGASIWQYQPLFELCVNCMHCTHVYQAVCDTLYQRNHWDEREKIYQLSEHGALSHCSGDSWANSQHPDSD